LQIMRKRLEREKRHTKKKLLNWIRSTKNRWKKRKINTKKNCMLSIKNIKNWKKFMKKKLKIFSKM
jgi:hypothetical protein